MLIIPGLLLVSLIVWPSSTNITIPPFAFYFKLFLSLIDYFKSNPILWYLVYWVIYFTCSLFFFLIDFATLDLNGSTLLSSSGNPLPTGGGHGNSFPLPTGNGSGNGNPPPAGGEQPSFPCHGILHDNNVNPRLNAQLRNVYPKLSELLAVKSNTNLNAGLTMNSNNLTNLTFTLQDRACMQEQIRTVHPTMEFRFGVVNGRGFSYSGPMTNQILGLFRPS